MKVDAWLPRGPRILVDYRLSQVKPAPAAVRLLGREIGKVQRPINRLRDPWSRGPLRAIDSVQFVLNPPQPASVRRGKIRATAYCLKDAIYFDAGRYRGRKMCDRNGLLAHELGHLLMAAWPAHQTARSFRRAMKVFRAWRLESRRASQSTSARARYMSRRNADMASRVPGRRSRWQCPTPRMQAIKLVGNRAPFQQLSRPAHAGFIEFMADAFATAIFKLERWRPSDRTDAVLKFFPRSWHAFLQLVTGATPTRRRLSGRYA